MIGVTLPTTSQAYVLPPPFAQPSIIGGYFSHIGAMAGGIGGSPVTQWTDLSGNGNHLVQGTFLDYFNNPHSTTTATFETNQINSYPSVRFDGVSNSYVFTTPFSFYDSNANDGTIITVASITAGDGVLVGGRQVADDSPFIYRFHVSSQQGAGTPNNTGNGYNVTWNGSAAADSDWHQMNVNFIGPTSVSFRIDGSTDGTTGDGIPVIGNQTVIGCNGSNTALEYLTADVAALFIYCPALSLGNIEAIETALAGIYFP